MHTGSTANTKKIARGKTRKPGRPPGRATAKTKAGKGIDFLRGILYIKRALKNSKLKCLKKQAELGLKKAREYFKGKNVKVPKNIPVGGVKSGGFIVATLSALAALATVISGSVSVYSAIKKVKNDKELLAVEKSKNKMLENYFLAHTSKEGHGLLQLKKDLKKKNALKLVVCRPRKTRG